jgi:hypothetical protein
MFPFARPHYTSDTTQFLAQLKEANIQAAAAKKAADTAVADLAAAKKAAPVAVAATAAAAPTAPALRTVFGPVEGAKHERASAEQAGDRPDRPSEEQPTGRRHRSRWRLREDDHPSRIGRSHQCDGDPRECRGIWQIFGAGPQDKQASAEPSQLREIVTDPRIAHSAASR